MSTVALILFIYFMLFFVVATIIKNNSIVDIGWGLGYVVTAWITMFIFGVTLSKIVLNVLVSLWGLRLFIHILERNIFEEEDFRYKKWREDWGKYVVPRAFLQVFMLQGLVMFIVGYGVFLFNVGDYTLSIWSTIGFVLVAIGFFFEVVGDWQLRNHIKQKTGTLLTTGLWKYTRHPNYFGDATIWWGFFFIVVLSNVPLYVIIGPIVMTYLLRFVSGVPLLEKKMEKREGWETYKKQTNAFIPWFRKKA